jgi:TIR domain
MRNLKDWKYLLTVIPICLLIAFVSWFFLPVLEIKWRLAIISVVASFIAGTFLVALIRRVNRKTGKFIPIILACLVLVSTFIYIKAWDKIVCTVPNYDFTNTSVNFSNHNIITGTELIDKSDPELIGINKSSKKCSICEDLNETNPERIWVHSSIESSKIKLYSGFLFMVVSVTVLIIFLAVKILFRKIPVDFDNSISEEIEDKVFISYNHEDHETAKELCDALLQHNIKLIVDSTDTAMHNHVQNMTPGDDIYVFIRKSIAKSKITLMIVSENSLLSGWVATETINTFFLESFDQKKSFIACYTDQSFMDRNFPAIAYAEIDQKLDAINNEIMNRNKHNVDSRDLNDQKTRLLMLRNNLDKTFNRLQNSLCIDISGGQLKGNMQTIVNAIILKFNSDT